MYSFGKVPSEILPERRHFGGKKIIQKKVALENFLFQAELIFSISFLYVGSARKRDPFFIGLFFKLEKMCSV